MSSSDVRDILSLPSRAAPDAARPPVRAPPTLPGDARPKHRPEGMSRELYALLGPNAPSLVMSGAAVPPDGMGAGGLQHAFQPKFQRSKAGVVRKWLWTPFRNPARSDTPSESSVDGASSSGRGLILHHWKPLDPQADDASGDADDAALDSAWAAFNTSSHVLRYTNDEYTQHLQDERWTREETDYLLEMCDTYDLRFIVIADRYEWPGSERSIEDIKARYYTICRRLLRERVSSDDVESRQWQLQAFAYDAQQETERKLAVQKLFSRTPEQLAEEEALFVESRRLEQNEARFTRERHDLLRLLGGWEGVAPSSASTAAAVGAGLVWPPGQASADDDAKKAKKRRTDAGTASGAKGAKSDAKQQLFDAQHFLTRFATSGPHVLRTPYPSLVGTPSILPPVAPASAAGTKAESQAHHGAYLRSTRMLSVRATQQASMLQALAELDPPIGPRLVFPTAVNIEKWETLLGAVAGSLDMKKHLERAEAEYQIVQARLAAAQGAPDAASVAATPAAPAAPREASGEVSTGPDGAPAAARAA